MRFIHAIYIACGTLYLAMPMMVWVLLHQRHPLRPLRLWCTGALLLPIGMVLQGSRSFVPELTATVPAAQAFIYAGAALHLAALRLEAQQPPHLARLLLVSAAAVGLLALVEYGFGPLPRGALENLMPALFAIALAGVTHRLARARGSRSARLLMALYLFDALVLLARMTQRLLLLPHDLTAGPDLPFTVAAVLLLVSAIASNVGYIGLALDRARRREFEQQQMLQGMHQQQVLLEATARGREMIAGERARTTRLLAHEVRQPLHNAAVSLQQALATLEGSDDRRASAKAIAQAQEVIRTVSATLDNTVAATTLLTGPEAVPTIDTDLPLLLELCLGDLPPQARQRVRIDYRADARSAQLEPTLLRLALRNLLDNATLYAPAPTPVLLRVLDSDQPLALVIEVVDEGPGIPPALRERVFDEGQRGDQPTVPGHGLGLFVVRRVAQLHGGQAQYLPNAPHGAILRLTLPQADPGWT